MRPPAATALMHALPLHSPARRRPRSRSRAAHRGRPSPSVGSLGLVKAGLGVAVLPRLATPGDGHPTIRTLALEKPEVTRTIGIVRRHGAVLSPPAAQFMAMLLES